MKFDSNRSLIQPQHVPSPPQAQPIDLGFVINTHKYLITIPAEQRTETVHKAIRHLEEQIVNVVMSIRFGPQPL